MATVSEMIRRFRQDPPTSRSERNAAKLRGEVPRRMWYDRADIALEEDVCGDGMRSGATLPSIGDCSGTRAVRKANEISGPILEKKTNLGSSRRCHIIEEKVDEKEQNEKKDTTVLHPLKPRYRFTLNSTNHGPCERLIDDGHAFLKADNTTIPYRRGACRSNKHSEAGRSRRVSAPVSGIGARDDNNENECGRYGGDEFSYGQTKSWIKSLRLSSSAAHLPPSSEEIENKTAG